MQKVYFISGLGADRRVFSYLDLHFCEPVFIDWITPLPKETLPAYALRLRQTIPEESPVIVGLSLGGMLAAEMAAADDRVRAVLIASNKHSRELPRQIRILKFLPVYKLMPGFLLKKMQFLYTYAFSVKDKEHKKILYQLIANADIPFIKWAIGAIANWRYQPPASNIVHVHGTADRLLLFHLVQPNYVIQGGTHIMTMDKHEEISALLKDIIQQEKNRD